MTVNLARKPVYYPSSDGKPMAENTIQYDWLTIIKSGLEEMTEGQDTFVAGDLLWYPVEGNNRIRVAPDVMAAVGRPKGPRSSYLQWKEDFIAPQIVIEILSPGNRKKEMADKLDFYDRFGVEEYIIYYPHKNQLQIYQRANNKLVEVETIPRRWTSKYLGFHLEQGQDELAILHPDGAPFKTFLEIVAEKRKAIADKEKAVVDKKRAVVDKEKAVVEKEKAIIEKEKAVAAKEQAIADKKQAKLNEQRATMEKAILAQKLKELGIDPDQLLPQK